MSRAANGTYTAPTSSWNPAVEGTAVDETDWNSLLDDIETALSDSLSKSGLGKVTAHIDFDETTVTSPDANVGRLYVKDVGGVTSLFFKDNAGTDTNLLLSSPGLAYTFSTSTTTTSDPGSGYIRFNNATLASVTEIAIDDNDANGADLSAYILTWDDVGTSDRGTLIVQNRTAPANVVIFTVSGASTDESGWTRLAVTYVTSAGSFSADAPLGVTFTKPGATGATGATGSAGADGNDGAAGADGVTAGVTYAFDAATSGDPGTGEFLLNNATVASVTAIHISDTDGDGNDISAWVATWDDSTSTANRGHVLIRDKSDSAAFAVFDITGASTDNTSYFALSVTHVVSAGTFSGDCSIQFYRAGDKGTDGAGAGDVVGPASSTNNGFVKFDGTTGKLVKDGAATVAIGSEVSGLGTGVSTALAVNVGSAGAFVVNGGALGTPSSGTLTNATGLPISTGVSGLGAGVATALAVNVGSAGAPVVNGGALGTPSSGTLTNATGLPISSGVSGLGTGVATFLGTPSYTNLAAALTGSVLKTAGVETIWIPAAAMVSRTTNGAASGTVEMTTNKNMFSTLDFDATTTEYAQFAIRMPKSWNEGTVTAAFTWSHASTTTNFGVAWQLAGVALSDGDAGDVAFGTVAAATDTGGTTNDIYITSQTAGITIGGTPAAEDWVLFQVERAPGNGADTMAIDARLHGVTLYVTTNATNDA